VRTDTEPAVGIPVWFSNFADRSTINSRSILVKALCGGLHSKSDSQGNRRRQKLVAFIKSLSENMGSTPLKDIHADIGFCGKAIKRKRKVMTPNLFILQTNVLALENISHAIKSFLSMSFYSV